MPTVAISLIQLTLLIVTDFAKNLGMTMQTLILPVLMIKFWLATPIDKVEALNENPILPPNQFPKIHDINTVLHVATLDELEPNKSAIPDTISTCILKLCAAEISPLYSHNHLRKEPSLVIGSKPTFIRMGISKL